MLKKKKKDFIITNLMTKLCISTLNQTILLILSNNFLYQSNQDFLIFQATQIFIETAKHYQNVLNQSGYNYQLQCKPSTIANNNSSTSKHHRKNIIWFNLPFSKNVSTNTGKVFYYWSKSICLLITHFEKYSMKWFKNKR